MRSDQPSFTDVEYGNRRRVSRRVTFLATMDATVPWSVWVGLIEPYYYRNPRGRKPKPIETMLWMYLLQVWFSLWDEGVEEAIYDSYAMRRFMGLDFTVQQVSGRDHVAAFPAPAGAARAGPEAVRGAAGDLPEAGLDMRGGSIVDATIIAATLLDQERLR